MDDDDDTMDVDENNALFLILVFLLRRNKMFREIEEQPLNVRDDILYLIICESLD